MKILNIITVGKTSGGAETTVHSIKKVLEKNGHNVFTLSSDLKKSGEKFSDFEFESINAKNPLNFFFQLFNIHSFLALRKILKEHNPDIVHLHTMWQVSPAVLFLLKNYPTVMTLHGPEAFLKRFIKWLLPQSDFKKNTDSKYSLTFKGKIHYFYFRYILRTLYKIGLKNVDLFLAPSRYMEQMAKSDISPIMHLPNSIELRKFYPLKNTYKLLFVGRLESVKGVEFLIQALPSIIKRFPQTTLTIVGDGPDKADLLKQAKDLKLEKSIQFVGWVNNKNLDKYYQESSILVIPSIWPENFPTVCLEALSVGRPVIGTNVGGIPEIIDNEINGYVVEPKRADLISKRIIHLFENPQLLQQMSAKARGKSRDFSIETQTVKLEKVYKKVINRYKTN